MSKIPSIDDLASRANASALEFMRQHPDRWPLIVNHAGPFLFDTDPAITDLMTEIDRFSGFVHSGASMAMTMRFLQSHAPGTA